MPPRKIWHSDDRRDALFDRTFTVFDLGDVGSIRGGHVSVLVLLACPPGSVDRAVMVDRQHSTDARRDARALVDMVNGADGPDRDRARNLRNRLALARRDFGGPCDVKVAVHYGPKIPARDRDVEQPTPAMLERVRHAIQHEDGFGGFHWHSAITLDELPVPPHARLHLALVGVDARGRIFDALPRPNVFDLDKSMRRDVRQLAAAMIEHPVYRETVSYCAERGLRLLFLWRPERRERSAA